MSELEKVEKSGYLEAGYIDIGRKHCINFKKLKKHDSYKVYSFRLARQKD